MKRKPSEIGHQQKPTCSTKSQIPIKTFCCRAGQSRSVAIVFSIAHHRLGADAALELLNPRRHSPNSLIIELAATIIEDPMFATTFQNWQAANEHIRLIDYVDEIERELNVLESNGAHDRIVQS